MALFGFGKKKVKSEADGLNSPEFYDLMLSAAGLTPASVKQLATVNTCVRALSESVAMTPLHVYKKSEDGGREKATGHPLYDVLKNKPNDWMTAYEMKEFYTRCLLLRGNTYNVITRFNGKIRELIPLSPGEVSPQQAKDFRVTYKMQDGSVRSAKDVLHMRDASDDCLLGLSRIEQNRRSLNIAASAESWGETTFSKQGVVPGYLTSDRNIKEEQQTQIRDAWRGFASGEKEGVPVMPPGMEYKTVSINLEDAQFLETRKFQREDICGIFRVPPHIAQLYEKSTSWGTGIEQVSLQFIVFSLMPILNRIENAMECQLLTRAERQKYQIRFNANALLRGDMKSRSEFYAKALLNGFLCINEVRKLENLNPIEGGDVYRVPSNTEELLTGMMKESEGKKTDDEK